MNPAIELKDLLLVRAIARSGGVSHAARSLHLSQSAISHHLSRLEARLGVALFERVGRRLSIAAAGTRLVTLADEILPKIAAVERELSPRRIRPLKLATQCYTTYQWFPGLTSMMAVSHPDVQLRIVLEATGDPLSAFEARELDFAIIHSDPPKKKGRGGEKVVSRVITKDKLMLVMAPDHPLASRKRLSPVDLHPHTFFVFDSSARELRAQGNMTFPAGDAPPKIQRVPLTEALLHLVRSGQGVSLLGGWTVRPYLERGELVSRPLTGARLQRTWRAVYRDSGPLAEPLKSLAQFLVDHQPLR